MSIAPDTLVLCADLRWVRADELAAGVDVVAFDADAPGGRGGRRKWRKSAVLEANVGSGERVRIETDVATLVVDIDHQLLCTARGPTHASRGHGLQSRSESPTAPGYGQRWVRAQNIRPSDQIVYLREPWRVGETHTHGYLKGIADGEGWVDASSGARIGIAQNPGPVLDEIGEALKALRITARFADVSCNKVKTWTIMGVAECLRFLGEVRPTRLLRSSDRMYVGRMLSGGAKKSGHPTAVAVRAVALVGAGAVVRMRTSSGTLIANGLCSR